MTENSPKDAPKSIETIVQDLLTILAWLDNSGHARAAVHINQALEVLQPEDPRIALLARKL
jgi:hypothetical protein